MIKLRLINQISITKSLRYISSLFFLLMVFPTGVHSETLSLCAYFNWNPWIYSKEGRFEGIMIEQLEVFKAQNPSINVEIQQIDNWKRCQLEVASGRVTMLLGANKTADREVDFDYLPIPAFVNQSSVVAYSLEGIIAPVHSLEELKKYSLSIDKGNKFGEIIDSFIKSLPAENVFEVNSLSQSIQMVELGRIDYFFSDDSTYKTIEQKLNLTYPIRAKRKLQKIFTVPRSVPVYYAFGKKTDNYEKFADKWLDAIKSYYNFFVIDDRIEYHRENSSN